MPPATALQRNGNRNTIIAGTNRRKRAESGSEPARYGGNIMADTTIGAAPGAEGVFRIGAVLARSFAILSRQFGKFFIIGAIIWAPQLIIGLLALEGVRPSSGNLAAVLLVAIGGILLWFLLSILSQAVMIYGAFQDMRGRSFAIGESLAAGFRRFWPIIGLCLAMAIGCMLGMVLLVVPGFILFLMWYVALPTCVVERKGPFASMGRSRALTRGHRWKIFGLFLLVSIGGGIVQAIISAVLGLAGPLVPVIGLFLWEAVFGAFGAILAAVVYHDLRVAKEGIDTDRIAAVFD